MIVTASVDIIDIIFSNYGLICLCSINKWSHIKVYALFWNKKHMWSKHWNVSIQFNSIEYTLFNEGKTQLVQELIYPVTLWEWVARAWPWNTNMNYMCYLPAIPGCKK